MATTTITIVVHDPNRSKQPKPKRKPRRRQSDACGEIRAAVVRRCGQ